MFCPFLDALSPGCLPVTESCTGGTGAGAALAFPLLMDTAEPADCLAGIWAPAVGIKPGLEHVLTSCGIPSANAFQISSIIEA